VRPSELTGRILRQIRGASEILRARILLRSCKRGRRLHATGYVRVENRGTIELGDGVTLKGGAIPTELVCGPGATLSIGPKTFINYGCSIEAHSSIQIGHGCMFAKLVRVCDCSPYGIAPIIIGDDVWMAHGVIIEPGVSIGDGSVVAAGSVVTRDVPPAMLAIGNPARCMSLRLRSVEAAGSDTAGASTELG
jgi:acetyltransferase-like isoleucine patch superfamily enzyme